MILGNYQVAVHRGVAKFAMEHGWNLNAEMAHVPVLPYGWSGNGIIAGLAEWEEPIHFLQDPSIRKIPTVDLYDIRMEIPLPRVVGDHEMIGRLAAEYFLKGGWSRFAWFSRVNNNVSMLRKRAYDETLKAAGFSAFTLAPSAVDKGSWQSIQLAVLRDFRAIGFPLAVFAYNDYDASFIQNVCTVGGISVPDEVAVLGVDNNPLTVNCLPVHLSSIRHDLESIGYQGAALLHHLMQGGKPPKEPPSIQPLGIAERASTETIPVQDPLIRRVITHMKKNLANKITVSDLTVVAGVSRRSLEISFKKETRRTLFEQLNIFRLHEARRLLEETSLSVTQIAKQSGFSTAPHLHREFRKHFNATPRDWRIRIAEHGSH